MNFDLSKFKKISEDKKSAVMLHPEGHKITIAKHVLSPKMRSKIAELPMHLAEGTKDGPVQEPNASYDPTLQNAPTQASDSQPNASFQPQPTQQPNIVINNTPPPQPAPQQVAQAQPVQDQRFNPVNQAPNQMDMANTHSDPYGANAYANVAKEGLRNQMQGINETATAQNQQNQAVAKERDAAAQGQQQLLNDTTSHINNLRAEHAAFIKDYQNQHIDPNHFLNSMGTGHKIATAIGLILGGMSSGFTHQGNPALDLLHKQIANDIEAQKSELGKTNNLLSANMQQFGNEKDAVTMTMAMQNSIVANKLEAAALKTGNPVLIARAKQAAGSLESQNPGLFSQIAVRQSLQNQGQGGQQGQQAKAPPPSEQIRMMGMTQMMPEADQKRAYDELGKKEEAESLRSQITDAYNDLNDKYLHGTFSPADRHSAIQAIAGKLAKVSEGRFNLEESKQQIEAFLQNKFESEQTSVNKLRRMNNFIDGLAQTPVLDAYRIKYQPATSPIDQSGKSKVAESAPVLPK